MAQIATEMQLQNLQNWFLGVTTHPESVVAGIAAHAEVVPGINLERLVKPSERESAVERLEIYHRSFFGRLIECLADDYPVIQYALGDEAFRALCRRYIVEYPSTDPNLNGFGRHLPEFIRERGEGVPPFLHELAQLEWALVEAIHAAAPEALSAAVLQRVAPEELASLRFMVSSAAKLLTLEFRVDPYVTAFFEGLRPSAPDHSPTVVAVVRSGYRIHRLEIEPNPACLLGRLMAGESLGAALAGIDATPNQLQSWFQAWTKAGMFASVLVG